MKTNLKFGMLQTIYTAEEEIVTKEIKAKDAKGKDIVRKEQTSKRIPIRCADPKCGRPVIHDAPCFVDTNSPNGDVYCDDCGKCLRYERKKAAQRKANGRSETPVVMGLNE
jgi:hypothetical protein